MATIDLAARRTSDPELAKAAQPPPDPNLASNIVRVDSILGPISRGSSQNSANSPSESVEDAYGFGSPSPSRGGSIVETDAAIGEGDDYINITDDDASERSASVSSTPGRRMTDHGEQRLSNEHATAAANALLQEAGVEKPPSAMAAMDAPCEKPMTPSKGPSVSQSPLR